MKNKKESQKNGCITYDLTGGSINKNEIPALSVGIQAGLNYITLFLIKKYLQFFPTFSRTKQQQQL